MAILLTSQISTRSSIFVPTDPVPTVRHSFCSHRFITLSTARLELSTATPQLTAPQLSQRPSSHSFTAFTATPRALTTPQLSQRPSSHSSTALTSTPTALIAPQLSTAFTAFPAPTTFPAFPALHSFHSSPQLSIAPPQLPTVLHSFLDVLTTPSSSPQLPFPQLLTNFHGSYSSALHVFLSFTELPQFPQSPTVSHITRPHSSTLLSPATFPTVPTISHNTHVDVLAVGMSISGSKISLQKSLF